MIRQALHGYEQGHRLLASNAPLASSERELLDRLSDLPGYLPLNFRFTRYLTGYPCGDGYALASTWPDPDAPRGGAVHTHTLLLDEEAWATASFVGLCSLFRRPSGGDRGAYRGPVTLPSAGADPDELAADLVATVFGPVPKPLCRLGVGDAERSVGAIWARLWPEARRRFAFSTCAFAPVSLPDRPFDLLFVPTEAKGSFSRASVTWVESAREPHAWVSRVSAPRTIPTWIERCRATGCRLPRTDEVWLLARLEELEQPAQERLVAARTRADLLARLWPSVADAPECWRVAFIDLIRALPQAPTGPHPYWELGDVLARPQLADLQSQLPELASAVRGEVEHRFRAALPPPALMTYARAIGLEGVVIQAAQAALAQAESREEVERLVQRSISAGDGLVEALLGALRRGERAGACGDLVGRDAVLAAARGLGDPFLLLASQLARNEDHLPEALDLAQPDERVEILKRANAVEARAWVLAAGAAMSDREIVSLDWAPEDIVDDCVGAPQGARVFDLLVRSVGRSRRASLFAAHPDLAERILRERSGSPVAVDAAEAWPPDRLPDVVEPEGASDRLLDALTSPLVRRLLGGPPNPQLRRFLDVPAVVRRLAALPRWQVQDLVRGMSSRGMLGNLVASGGAALAQAPTLLVFALREADRLTVDEAAEGLLAVNPWPLLVAAEVVGVVRRHAPVTGPGLLERAFVPVWRAAVQDTGELSGASWWYDLWWDRAKNLRHWLVDVWVREGWPPEPLDSILRVAPELKEKTKKRLLKSSAGASLARRLPSLDEK